LRRLICPVAQERIAGQGAAKQPAGQISNILSSGGAKNILVFLSDKSPAYSRYPASPEGRLRNVRKCEAGSGGRDASGAFFGADE
jgi:hypothetical protein